MMSTVANILDSIVKYAGSEQLTIFLKSCDESRAFSSEDEESVAVIALTNRLLNESSTRRQGLQVLKCLLSQLPSNLLQANLVSWTQQAVKGLSQKESSSTVCVAAEVANILLAMSSKFADCRKQIALNVVGNFFEVLYGLKESPEFLKVVLSSLRVLQEHFSKSATSWKDKFEKLLFTLIEKDDETVYLASRCYIGKASCGLPGTDNVNYKDGWASQFKSLSSTLHILLDRLFENVNEIEQFSRGLDSSKPNIELPPVSERLPFLKLSRQSTQFVSLCEFVKTMLLGSFPVSKKVVPELVLSVACRGLAVTVKTLQAQVTSDTPILISQMPRIHLACLSILQSLIKSCKANLIFYGPVICKLISQVLKSTETKKSPYGQYKPYRSVRMAAYDCLTSWLTVASCSSSVEKHPEIVDFILSDIQFKKPAVTLNLSNKMLKGRIGKKQRQALVNQTISNKEEFVADREANKEACLAALKSIPPLLESVSTLLTPEAHKALQTAVSSELVITQLNSGDRIPLPYSDKCCRLALYKSFVAMCQNHHPSFPPPLSFASEIISNGLLDSSDEIVQFCTTSLSSVDKILRPIGPTLSYPIDLPELIFKSKKNSFEITECESIPSSTLSNKPDKELQLLDMTPLDNLDDRSFIQPNGNHVISGSNSLKTSQLELDLLLDDPGMSEFSNDEEKSPGYTINVPSKHPSGDNTRVNSCSDDLHNPDEGNTSETERSDTCDVIRAKGNDKITPTSNGENFSKRKPEGIAEASPSSKRIKVVVLTESGLSSGTNTIPEEANISVRTPQKKITDDVTQLEATVDPIAEDCISSSEGVIEITDDPDNVVEEEMLNSFVDEVN